MKSAWDLKIQIRYEVKKNIADELYTFEVYCQIATSNQY